jgi:hypothetical protein
VALDKRLLSCSGFGADDVEEASFRGGGHEALRSVWWEIRANPTPMVWLPVLQQ